MKSLIGGKWSLGTPLNPGKRSFGLVPYENKIYCIGGESLTNPFIPSNTVNIYDTVTDLWSSAQSMPKALSGNTCVINRGKIYSLGGRVYAPSSTTYYNDLYIYDIQTDSWDTGASMPTKNNYVAAAIVEGKIYCAGGMGVLHSTLEIYDIATDTWIVGPNVPFNHIVSDCVAIGSDIYYVGGHEGTNFKGDIYVYHTITQKWSTESSLNIHRNYRASALFKTAIYTFNGRLIDNSGRREITSTEVYPLDLQTWLIGVDVPIAQMCQRATAVNGKIYIMAGEHNRVDIFTPGNECVIVQEYVSELGNRIKLPHGQAVDDGESLTLTAPAIEGYEYLGYRINGGSLQPGDTVQLDNIRQDYTVTYVYRKTLTITKQYRRANGTTVVQPDQLEAIAEGSDFIEIAPRISGYTRIGHKIDDGVQGSDLTAIILDVRENHTVTYLYDVGEEAGDNEATITHQYHLEDGTPLLPDDTGAAIVGEPYLKAAPSIEGYQLVRWQVDDGVPQTGTTARIDAVTSDHVITFVYKLDDGGSTGDANILIRFHDESGTQLKPSITETAALGQPYTRNADAITGYAYVGHTIDNSMLLAGSTASITSVTGDHVITFIYKVDDGGQGGSDRKCCAKVKIQIDACECNQLVKDMARLIAESESDCACTCQPCCK